MQCICIVASLPNANPKRHVFPRTIHPPSFIAIALMFSELSRGIEEKGGGGRRWGIRPLKWRVLSPFSIRKQS